MACQFSSVPEPLCQQCGLNESESGYAMPLCESCRDALAGQPFPPAIKITAIILFAVLTVAGARSVEAFRAGVAYEQGLRAERDGDYEQAVDRYVEVVFRYPESTQALARLGIARFRAGQPEEAMAAFAQLRGRQTSRELSSEVNNVIAAINSAKTQRRIKERSKGVD